MHFPRLYRASYKMDNIPAHVCKKKKNRKQLNTRVKQSNPSSQINKVGAALNKIKRKEKKKKKSRDKKKVTI